MNRPELKAILQNAYDRSQWISTLQFLTGKRDLLTVNLSPIAIEINTQEASRLVKSFHQIGTLKTSDSASLPIYEIILEDDIRIEHNRVGVNEFIKNYIVKDAIKGALTTFSYEDSTERSEWRFSFISKNSASDFFAEAEAEETNPKKYTYIFGNKEEHRTAIERLYNLEQSRFRLEDFFEAFNVEPVSKKFFEEYKHLYREFSNFIASDKTYFSLFENPNDPSIKPEKEIRNFVSRLLGRIVFLYFLQKKNWLGANSTEYKDGSTTFLSDLFFNDESNQDDFYNKYLCPVFFEALNTADRKNDEFKLENGKKVCIPFLNGGLFEEDQEPKGHRNIKIPAFQFKMLFDFFNGFNFTVYENSPEEHTVAVDPEMLGHIFENLIDYNKDTGTFYTPKEIVQYMTQESLIEYLNTHLEKDRSDIENMVKNQNANHFEDVELTKINQLLDDVKICDPAIGSGAFPMGMLQEIFNLKALINFKLGFDVWSPATVKQNIIQNSIYGVDLDEGAVEIARLRFWLSLVVDEGMPKALPNLDYKIMQGNSLLESYKGIDLSGISSGNDLKIVEKMQTDLFGNLVDNQMKITVGKSGLAEELQKLIKKYFTAKATDKKNIKNKIESKIAEHIEFNIELREYQLQRQIAELENVKTLKPAQKKALQQFRTDLQNLEQTKADLKKEQKKDEKNYFLWHLFFSDILSKGGFDIVIGNPPYIEFKNLDKELKAQIENYSLTGFVTAKGKYDIYIVFYEQASRICKRGGIISYISPTRFLNRDYGRELRKYIYDNLQFTEIVDFGDKQNFESAMTYTGIFILINDSNYHYNFYVKNSTDEIANTRYESSILEKESWYFNDQQTDKILGLIRKNSVALKTILEGIFQGVATGKDEVFILKEEDILKKNIEKDFLVKFLKGKDISPYKIDWKKTFCIYPYDDDGKVISEEIIKEKSPNLYKYLLDSKELLKGRGYFDKSNKFWFELWNQRNKKRFLKSKILTLDNASRNSFVQDDSGFLGTTTTYSLIPLEPEYAKILLSILNSKILNYYHQKNTIPQAGGFYRYQASFIEDLPINVQYFNLEFLNFFVNVVVLIKGSNLKEFSNNISSIHLSSFFEEVIDGLVFDLYFEEEMKSKDIYITDEIKLSLQKNNVGDNFEDLEVEQKKEIILALYKEWSTGSVQIKMTDYITKSPDILKPILQS